MTENLNEGHRARLRKRMMKEGLQNFEDHEVLELMLFQFIPRKDTNKIAHSLLNKFGSLANVLDAYPDQLQTVDGISEVTACGISMIKEIVFRYRISSLKKRQMSKISSIIDFSRELIAESYEEKLVVVYVDNATNFLVSEVISSGNTQEVRVDMKKLVFSAISCNASGVLLFHCHPNGECLPSAADNAFTEKVFVTLANLGLVLLEHLIFNNSSNYYSYYQSHKIDEITEKYIQFLQNK